MLASKIFQHVEASQLIYQAKIYQPFSINYSFLLKEKTKLLIQSILSSFYKHLFKEQSK